MKKTFVFILLSLLLAMQSGCVPLASAAGITVFKLADREQQRQETILRNSEYHLKRGEHLELLIKHGIYPQKAPARS